MLDDAILRLAAVKKATGLSRTTIYVRARAGTFPAPVSIGGHRIGWRESEIKSWIEGRDHETEPKIGRQPSAQTVKRERTVPVIEWEVVTHGRGRRSRRSGGTKHGAATQLQGRLPF